MSFHPHRQHTAQCSPAGGSARTSVLMAIGASTFFINAWPSAFFGAPTATEPATKAPMDSAALAARSEQRAAFYKEPRFLKLLLPQEAIVKMGGPRGITQLADKTKTKVKLAKKGEYYPFSIFPVKPCILAGDQQALLAAFRDISAIWQKDEDEHVTFLLPTSCRGGLIGTGGGVVQTIRDKTSARITIDDDRRAGSVTSEFKVIVSGKAAVVEAVAEWLLAKQDEYIDDMRKMLHTEYQTANPLSLPATVLVLLEDNQAARLMGKGGLTLQKTAKMHGVGMEYDRSSKGPNGETILKISGAMGDVHAAHANVVKNFVVPKPSWKE